MARQERACVICGVRTTSNEGLCPPCKRPTRKGPKLKPSETLNEGDGKWVLRKGIQVWEEW